MSEKLKNDKLTKSQPLSRRLTILTTSAILFGNFTFGCCLNAFSPVLDHMRSKYETTIDDISMIFTIATSLYCIGAIACSFISNYINRQLIAIVSLIGMTSSMFLTPYCPNTILFFVIGGLLGFSSGLYDASQIVWIIELWQQKAGPFIQAQHFSYAIGAIIPAVIAAPFLDKNIHSKVNTAQPPLTETIQIPFWIIGTLTSLALVYQLFLFTFYRYHTPPMYANENFELIDNAKNIPSPTETDLSGNVSINQQENANVLGVSKRKLKFIAIAILFLGPYQAMEVCTLQFLPTFGQYSDLKMTESASAYVLTGLTGMLALGRLIGIFIIFKVRPELMIFTSFIVIVTGNLILTVWASNSLTMFWIGSVILGAGYSTMYPSFCAFIEKYLVFTTPIASSIIVFGATMSAIYPVIIGRLIEHTAVVLPYTNFFSTIICVIAMFCGYKLSRNSVSRER